MVDMLPRQFADVDEAVHAAEVDERTEADHRRHGALTNLANLEVVEELISSFFLVLFEERAPAEHDVVAILVELDDLGLHDGADVRRKIAHTAQFDE